jgi:hypothetical protein
MDDVTLANMIEASVFGSNWFSGDGSDLKGGTKISGKIIKTKSAW